MSRVTWVTGATGFTGRHLVDYLRGIGDRTLVGLGRSSAKSWLKVDEYHQLDLATDTDQLHTLVARDRPSQVFHLAGLLPPASTSEYYLSHVHSTVNLIMALHRVGLSSQTRLLTVGSAAEYATPYALPITEDAPTGGQTPYGASKSAQTATALALSRSLGLEVVVVRPFNLIGPHMSTRLALGWLTQEVAAGKNRVLTGNLESCRDFVDVRDAARGYVSVLRSGHAANVYNICTGHATPVKALCDLLREGSGKTISFVTDQSRVRSQDPAVVVGNPNKIQAICGWKPNYTLAESVGDVLRTAVVGSISYP